MPSPIAILLPSDCLYARLMANSKIAEPVYPVSVILRRLGKLGSQPQASALYWNESV